MNSLRTETAPAPVEPPEARVSAEPQASLAMTSRRSSQTSKASSAFYGAFLSKNMQLSKACEHVSMCKW